jgi:ABC-type sulfate transport system permease component
MGPWRVLWHVTLPLAWRSIATRLVLTCARAISEFGAVVILIYCPMTAPVKIYELFLRWRQITPHGYPAVERASGPSARPLPLPSL